jgi:hypothetical protein
LWSGKLNASDYGADNTAGLRINENAKLMGTIAYTWMFQTLPSVQQQFVQGDPNAILEKLKEVLKPSPDETYTVRIFHGTGGHAVTPYAVEDNGNGLFHVLVWDNNYVGVTRAIEFDTNANTWKYNAALNPNEPSEQYTGDAQTPNIDLDPSSPGLETQAWPYAGNVGADVSQSSTGNAGGATLAAMKSEKDDPPDTNLIYLDASETDHAHLLITNPKGEKIGFENGKLVNTMPGAHTVIHALNANWNENPEPEYEVPDGVDYTIKLDATDMKEADDDVSIGVIAPGYELYVDNLNVQPGEVDTLKATVDAEKVEFSPSEEQSPSIEVGISTEKEDWTFTVNGDVIPAGATDTIDLPIDGDTMTVSTAGSADPSEVSLAVERIDDNGEQHFSHDGISLDDGDSAALKYGGWTDGATMPLTVNHAGQSETQQLRDEAQG